MGLIPCCSSNNRSCSACFCGSVSHVASSGASFTNRHQKKAQTIAGNPSRINIQRQPTDFTKYPETIDIQRTVAGFPRIKKVFARERSALVNHLLRKINMEGITALSTMPSKKRMATKKFTLLTKPVAVARTPQRIRDQKINFFALLVDAYTAPGI